MTRGRPILIILIRTCPKKQFLAEAICPTIKRFWHRFAHEESVVEMATSYPKSWDDPNTWEFPWATSNFGRLVFFVSLVAAKC